MSNASDLIHPDVAGRVLKRALGRGGDFAELYGEHRFGVALTLDDNRVEQASHGDELGASIRLVVGGATFFGHIDSLHEQALMEVADSVARAVAAGGQAGSVSELALAPNGSRLHPVQLLPEQVDVGDKRDLLIRCNDRARSLGGSDIRQVTVGYGESRQEVVVYNSEGLAATDDRSRVRLSVSVVADRDGRTETGSKTLGGHVGFELLQEDPEKVARDATEMAVKLLDAVDAPSGQMPVVVGNGFGGVLLHEAVGHGLEADAVQKQASVFAGRIGEQLAPAGVNAFDDGKKQGAWGSDGIDDEGTPTQATPILEDGVLTSFLYDRTRATVDGAALTGNGRRQSFRYLPVPRMTNTYFAPGSSTPAELIASVDHGLYAVSFGGGQVEPATGDFVFGVSEAYLIEHGEVTQPVRGVTLVGNGLHVLTAIGGVAQDLEIATGYCGKAGQRVPAGVGQPHVLINEMTVGGTAT